MASPILYNNGFGGTVGAASAISKPIWMLNGGHVWYVSSLLGSDAASPAGESRQKPLATLAQAHTNAVAGDTIVLLSGHVENVASFFAISKAGIKIYGEGSSTARPQFICNNSTSTMIVSGAGVSISNLYFPASTVAPAVRIDVQSTAGVYWDSCQFDLGTLDTGVTIRWGSTAAGAGLRITNSTFTVTAAVAGGLAISAITNASSDLYLNNVTFDGGSPGFTNWAVNLAVAVTQIQAYSVNQLNNAHITMVAGSSGIWEPGTVSVGSRFEQN